MNPDDVGFLEYAFKGSVGLLITAGGWLLGMLMKATAENKEALSDHKLHVSEHYAKKTEFEPINDALDEMRGDIKELLGRKRERDQ